MRTVSWRPLARVLAAVLVVGGCSSPPPRYPITDPAMALRVLRDRDRRVERLRAHGSADHYGERGRIRGEVFVFVERPQRMRVDTRAFGTTVSQLVTDGTHFTLADLRAGNFYTGPAEPCVAAQLLGIPLEAAEVVAVLAGGPPLYDGAARIRWDDGAYQVDVDGAQGRSERLTLAITERERTTAQPGDQRPWPTRAVLRDARGERAELTFEDYTEVDGVRFPRRVRVNMRRDNIDLQVRYRTVSLDPELPEDLYSTEAPPGLTEIPVDCAAQRLPPPAPEPAPTAAPSPSSAPSPDAGVQP